MSAKAEEGEKVRGKRDESERKGKEKQIGGGRKFSEEWTPLVSMAQMNAT